MTELDGRALVEWLNAAPMLPQGMEILYGELKSPAPGMSLEPGREEKILSRDIAGGLRAERSYSLTYRLRPGASQQARLDADKLLDGICRWAGETPPRLAGGPETETLRQAGRAAPVRRLAGGEEDHAVTLTVRYSVKGGEG